MGVVGVSVFFGCENLEIYISIFYIFILFLYYFWGKGWGSI